VGGRLFEFGGRPFRVGGRPFELRETVSSLAGDRFEFGGWWGEEQRGATVAFHFAAGGAVASGRLVGRGGTGRSGRRCPGRDPANPKARQGCSHRLIRARPSERSTGRVNRTDVASTGEDGA
jgi:hypothetical protein